MTIEESFNKCEVIKASYKVSEEFVYCLGQVWSYHVDLDEIFWPWTVFRSRIQGQFVLCGPHIVI